MNQYETNFKNLEAFFKKLINLETLKIDLWDNHLGTKDENLIAFGGALKNLSSVKTLEINLTRNDLNANKLIYLSEGLKMLNYL